MCYSFEASVFAGLVSYASSFVLLYRNQGYDQWLALFILSFSSIQWAEALLWKNMNNLSINQITTNWIIPIILASEGIVGLVGASLYHEVDPYLWILYIMIAFFIISSGNKNSSTKFVNGGLSWYEKSEQNEPSEHNEPSKHNEPSEHNEPSGHNEQNGYNNLMEHPPLQSESSDNNMLLPNNILPLILFAIYLVLPIYLYMEDDLDKYVIIFYCFGILLYAIINNKKNISSNWCYYANLLSFFALARPYI